MYCKQMQSLPCHYNKFHPNSYMENHQKQDLKIALATLKITIQNIDLFQNDSVDQCKEQDDVKENIENAVMLIEGVLNEDLKK